MPPLPNPCAFYGLIPGLEVHTACRPLSPVQDPASSLGKRPKVKSMPGGFLELHLVWRRDATDTIVFMTQTRLIPPMSRPLLSPLSQLRGHVSLSDVPEIIPLGELEAYPDGFSWFEMSATLPSASSPILVSLNLLTPPLQPHGSSCCFLNTQGQLAR